MQLNWAEIISLKDNIFGVVFDMRRTLGRELKAWSPRIQHALRVLIRFWHRCTLMSMSHQPAAFVFFPHTDNCLYFVATLEKDIDSLFDRLTLFTNAHASLILKVNGVPLQLAVLAAPRGRSMRVNTAGRIFLYDKKPKHKHKCTEFHI